MRHFHDSEMTQPITVNTAERMFGGCEDMGACCPGSHKAGQLEEDDIFFNKDILCSQSLHVIEVTTTTLRELTLYSCDGTGSYYLCPLPHIIG